MAHMYILHCHDGSYYTGSTAKDPELREWEHNADPVLGAAYTWKRRPAHLVYVEEFESIVDAFLREKQVQRWRRAKKEALIAGRHEELRALSRARPSTSSGTVEGC